MQNQRSKIILDTNLWISFLITKDLTKLDEIIFAKKCVLIFSDELLDEFLAVAKRSKLRRYFNQADLELLLETIEDYGELISITSQFDICRDAKDNFLLSLSVDGHADYLLTGDKDLLSLDQIGKTKITTISAFLQDNFEAILDG